MKKLFLDTNIVIDLLDKREPFCYDAVRLFTMAYNKKVQLLVSPMTYATASFLLRKHGPEEVRRLLNNFRLLSRVTTANERTVDESLVSQFADFEDALQYYSALTAKAEAIITRNKKDFANSKIPVMTAGEYLAAHI
ncbi:MAG: PIN domain-containing protein [Bacteroidaceae bacterium]|jgi:predicted nucleic acid-binding protein|nr:PIN domain-containing protein [Bacteroidaceae bacterium]